MLAGFSVEKLFIRACVILLMKMVDKTKMSAGSASETPSGSMEIAWVEEENFGIWKAQNSEDTRQVCVTDKTWHVKLRDTELGFPYTQSSSEGPRQPHGTELKLRDSLHATEKGIPTSPISSEGPR
ncbi:hypothetical protein HAX54_032090 [Datura stramonium]|uniref:Uncharacterized protein n=1 Tax=Datura stramonium TaxID=4076 RepID=A0ABS8SCC4_DATST|nr:hypothetical protein [Datura stramonium]